MADPDLEFFNSISGELQVELSLPAQPVANLANLAADPKAQIVSLTLQAEWYDEETGDFRDLTPAELSATAFHGSRITLRGESGGQVEHSAPNGEYFTVQELLLAVEETERQTRDNSEWLGGVDVHHCFFEGIHRSTGDVWEIFWGS